MSEKKRQQIKSKVKKGEARNRAREDSLTKRAAEARDSAVSFVRENPLLTIAGAVAVGVAVSMLFRRPREVTGKAAKQASRKASSLATVAVQVALPFIQQAIAGASDAGRAGVERAEELGESASKRAHILGRAGQARADETLEAAESAVKNAGRRIAKAVRARAN